MLNIAILSVLLLLTIGALLRVWWLREQAVRRLIELESEAAGLREKTKMLEDTVESRGDLGETFKGLDIFPKARPKG